MALSTKLVAQVVATLTDSLDLGTASAPLDYTKRITLTDGTGANQADKLWHDQRVIAASATDTLDLAGTLVDALGDTVTLARVKAVLVVADAANGDDVNVQQPATNGVPLFLAAGDGIGVKPGGAFLWVAPDADGVVVTDGTGDLLDLVNVNAAGQATVDIVIVGASA